MESYETVSGTLISRRRSLPAADFLVKLCRKLGPVGLNIVRLIVKTFPSLGLESPLSCLPLLPSFFGRGLFIETSSLDLLEEALLLKLTLQVLNGFFDVIIVDSYFQWFRFLSFPYEVVQPDTDSSRLYGPTGVEPLPWLGYPVEPRKGK